MVKKTTVLALCALALGLGATPVRGQQYLQEIEKGKKLLMVPQVAVDGLTLTWVTEIIVVNNGDSPAQGFVEFVGSDGRPLVLNFRQAGHQSVLPFQLQPGAVFQDETLSVPRKETVGYAAIVFDPGQIVEGAVIYSAFTPAGQLQSQVSVAAVAPANIFNSRVVFSTALEQNTGFALSNPNRKPLEVHFEFRDEAGDVVIQGSLPSGGDSIPAGGHLPRFITEIANLSSPIPDSFQGTMTLHSKDPFAMVALNLRESYLSALPSSNHTPPFPWLLSGRLLQLDDSPVIGQEIRLIDNTYRAPASGRAPFTYKVVTDAQGRFRVPLVRFFDQLPDQPDVTLEILSQRFYNYRHRVDLPMPGGAPGQVRRFDFGEIQMIPRATDLEGKKLDLLEWIKIVTANDGSGEDTLLQKWPAYPVPVKVARTLDPATCSCQQVPVPRGLLDLILQALRERNLATGDKFFQVVEELPSSASLGLVNQSGQSVPYGIEVVFPNDVEATRRFGDRDRHGNLLNAVIRIPFFPSSIPGIKELSDAGHELAHMVSGTHIHSPDNLHVLSDRRGDGHVTIFEGKAGRVIRSLRPAPVTDLSKYFK